MSLFKRLISPDRQQTQLAYRVKYFPWHELSPAARNLVAFRKQQYYQRAQINAMLSDDMTCITIKGRIYKIVWAYNNMPTEQEWNASSDTRLVSVELRASAAIDSFAVAIFSYELPSERLKAVASGHIPAGTPSSWQELSPRSYEHHSDFAPLLNKE